MMTMTYNCIMAQVCQQPCHFYPDFTSFLTIFSWGVFSLLRKSNLFGIYFCKPINTKSVNFQGINFSSNSHHIFRKKELLNLDASAKHHKEK